MGTVPILEKKSLLLLPRFFAGIRKHRRVGKAEPIKESARNSDIEYYPPLTPGRCSAIILHITNIKLLWARLAREAAEKSLESLAVG